MKSSIRRALGEAAVLLVGVLFVIFFAADVLAQSSSTVSVTFEKKFSGDAQGFTVDQFSFHVSGNAVDETVAHGESIELSAGSYTIEEIAPNGFDSDEWRIGWFGDCDSVSNMNGSDGTLEIDPGDIAKVTLACQADNQYRPENAESDDRTVRLDVEKKFSGPHDGYTEDQFSFHITGNGVDETIAHGGFLMFPIGAYTIEEIGPSGFDHDDWRVQWSGDVCSDDDTDDSGAAITIESSDLNKNTTYCRADNQLRPDEDGGGGGDDDDDDATLTVTKVIVNDNSGTSTASDFSFSVNGSAAAAFEADGTNVLALPAGTYTVVETSAAGYTTSYANCTGIVLSVGTHATCMVTNNDVAGGDGGSGGDDDNGGGDDDDNDGDDDGGGSGGGDDEDGGGSSSKSSSGGGGGDDDGEVAGAQTTLVPGGSPNTGFGGASGAGTAAMLSCILSFAGMIAGAYMVRRTA